MWGLILQQSADKHLDEEAEEGADPLCSEEAEMAMGLVIDGKKITQGHLLQMWEDLSASQQLQQEDKYPFSSIIMQSDDDDGQGTTLAKLRELVKSAQKPRQRQLPVTQKSIHSIGSRTLLLYKPGPEGGVRSECQSEQLPVASRLGQAESIDDSETPAFSVTASTPHSPSAEEKREAHSKDQMSTNTADNVQVTQSQDQPASIVHQPFSSNCDCETKLRSLGDDNGSPNGHGEVMEAAEQSDVLTLPRDQPIAKELDIGGCSLEAVNPSPSSSLAPSCDKNHASAAEESTGFDKVAQNWSSKLLGIAQHGSGKHVLQSCSLHPSAHSPSPLSTSSLEDMGVARTAIASTNPRMQVAQDNLQDVNCQESTRGGVLSSCDSSIEIEVCFLN